MNKHKPQPFTKYVINHYYHKDGMARSNNYFNHVADPHRDDLGLAHRQFDSGVRHLLTGVYDDDSESLVLHEQTWGPHWHDKHGWVFTLVKERTLKKQEFNHQPA